MLAKGAYGNLQIPQAVVKAIGCSPQLSGGGSIVEGNTYDIKHGEIDLMLSRSFNPIGYHA